VGANRRPIPPELHAVEEQLVVRESPAGPEDADSASGEAADGVRLQAGLTPAEPTATVLHRQDPAAAAALGFEGMVVLEDEATRAEPPG
jgi:hypothetical protein